MKPMLLVFLFLTANIIAAQSLDYISVRKQNGRVIKNFYTGSDVLLELTNGSYVAGPIRDIRNDSVLVAVYDIRYYPTPWGTYVKDTIATILNDVHFSEISRILLSRRRTFFQRISGPLLMLGGGGYLVLNLLNGALHKQPIFDKDNVSRISTAAGALGLGYIFTKLFASDVFSKKRHQLLYIDL